MLLNFEVENWMSYRDGAAFSTTGSLERQHMETLAKITGFRSKKALPVVAVYGGNASGKTGLFKAIAALKDMVTRDPGVNGVLPIEPFMLEDGATLRPTTFDITFLAGKNVYRLVVEATVDGVSYESLEIVKEKRGNRHLRARRGKGAGLQLRQGVLCRFGPCEIRCEKHAR